MSDKVRLTQSEAFGLGPGYAYGHTKANGALVRRLQTGLVTLYLTFFFLLLPQSEAYMHHCVEVPTG